MQRGEQSRLVCSLGHTSDGFLWPMGIRDSLMAWMCLLSFQQHRLPALGSWWNSHHLFSQLISLLKVLSSFLKAPCCFFFFFSIIFAITCCILHRISSNPQVFSVESRICQQLSSDPSKQSAFICLVFHKMSQLQQKSSPLEFAFLNIPLAYDTNSQFKYFLEFRVQKNE